MPTTAAVRDERADRPRASAGRRASRPVVVCGIVEPAAERALVAFAARLVDRVDGRLLLTHVQPAPLLAHAPPIAYAARASGTEPSLRAAARRLARLAADLGIAPTTTVHVGFGDLEDQLLETARREKATYVLVGSPATGHPAARLMKEADCPVIVVPPFGVADAAAAVTEWGGQPIALAPGPGDAASIDSNKGGNVTPTSVLVGVDGSQHARVALRHAARLAAELDARLVVAHVVQPSISPPGFGPTARQLAGIPVDALVAGGEALVDRILDEEHLADVDRRIVYGFPADRLADIADEEGAELIVVGSRGRGALRAAVLGSVSTDLIGVARCPVVVVPRGTESASGAPSEAIHLAEAV